VSSPFFHPPLLASAGSSSSPWNRRIYKKPTSATKVGCCCCCWWWRVVFASPSTTEKKQSDKRRRKTTPPPWVFKKKRGENKPLRLLRKPLFSVHCKMANVPLSQEWVEFSKALELGCERGAPGVTIEDAEKFRGPKKPRVFFFSFFLCAFGLSMARRARLLQVIS